MSSDNTKRKRSANFSNREIETLVDEVVKAREILTSKHNDAATNQRKDRAWDKIRTAVNAVGSVEIRSVGDLRIKWRKLHSSVKNKGAKLNNEARRTGGGSAPAELTAVELKILSFIPEELIVGIPGAIDSSENRPPNNSSPVLSAMEHQQETSISVPSPSVLSELTPRPQSSSTTNTPSTPTRRQPSVPTVSAVAIEQQTSLSSVPLTPIRRPAEAGDSRKRRRTDPTDLSEDEFLRLERERFQLERERLCVDRECLAVEKERLEVERDIFQCLKKLSEGPVPKTGFL